MLKLFIAKLSVYANCVPRSQSFYCTINMSVLFNVGNVSFGCCSSSVLLVWGRVPASPWGREMWWLLQELLLWMCLPEAGPPGWCLNCFSACVVHGLWYPPQTLGNPVDPSNLSGLGCRQIPHRCRYCSVRGGMPPGRDPPHSLAFLWLVLI